MSIAFTRLLFATPGLEHRSGQSMFSDVPLLNGTCDRVGCYIDMDGRKTHFLYLDENIPDSTNPCVIYQCTVRSNLYDM